TGDDNSSVANSIYYRSSGNLSWAMDFQEVWDYPFEDTDVQNAYFNFYNWVTSGGTSNPDWFENVSGNRDESLIYRPYGISKK
ncbi:MAG: LruC domain-containing protein, partial [Calditrichaeota bacterium]|nr:LruC domain-containing protein [Calditrichota bacterium]